MRIIGGQFKGRKLLLPNAEITRPTADLVKTSLFNILQGKIEGSVVLDLFAGSGALGIEAISRNAHSAYLVEKSKETFRVLKKNCDMISGNINIFNSDFIDALISFSQKNIKFNIVFLDPPYLSDLEIISLKKLIEYNLLSDDAIVVIEQEATNNVNYSNLDNYELFDERKYGRKKLYFLRRRE